MCNVARVRGQTYVSDKHTCPLYILFFRSGLGRQHTKGADGSRYQSIDEPTEPSQPVMSDDVSEDRPQHRQLCPHSPMSRMFCITISARTSKTETSLASACSALRTTESEST